MPEQLHPAALEILEALRLSQTCADAATVDEELLVRMACGFATQMEWDMAIDSLARSQHLRNRLVELRASCMELSEGILPSVSADSEADRTRIIQCLRKRLNAVLNMSEKLLGTLETGLLKLPISAAKEEAALLKIALSAIVQSHRLRMSQPTFADTRSGEGISTKLSPEISATILAVVDADRALNIEVEFLETEPGALNRMAGKTLTLGLKDPVGGEIPLALHRFDGQNMRIDLPNFGELAGLDLGPQPPSMFTIEFDGSNHPSTQKNTIFALVDPRIARGGRLSVPVELHHPPEIIDGNLRLTVSVPAGAREEYSSGYLEFAISLGPLTQVIGREDIGGWPTIGKTLSFPVPGAVDGQIRAGSIVQARIVSSSSLQE